MASAACCALHAVGHAELAGWISYENFYPGFALVPELALPLNLKPRLLCHVMVCLVKELPLLQAGIALRACVLMLEDAVRPQTCLRILALASSTGNQRLLATSAAVALLHFRQAFMQDQAGLLMLPKEVLGILLSHDCLQVGHSCC